MNETFHVDLLIIGTSTSGTCAAIQAARLGPEVAVLGVLPLRCVSEG